MACKLGALQHNAAMCYLLKVLGITIPGIFSRLMSELALLHVTALPISWVNFPSDISLLSPARAPPSTTCLCVRHNAKCSHQLDHGAS